MVTIKPTKAQPKAQPARVRGATPAPQQARRATRIPPGQVLSAVKAFLGSIELDEAGQTNAAIALALAEKLDQARSDTTGAVAMATAGLAKELRSVIDALVEATADPDEFVSELFQ